jgi:beta-glucosidase
MVASIVRPVKELKGFAKVHLQPGERRRVTFTIDPDTLSFFNGQLKWGAEPGAFQLMVGSASDDIRLDTTLQLQ